VHEVDFNSVIAAAGPRLRSNLATGAIFGNSSAKLPHSSGVTGYQLKHGFHEFHRIK
jgi:hypothetical protein